MLVFRKELMLKRLEEENLLDKVDDEVMKLMNELDGKEVHKNDWKALVFDELEYIARDSEGTTYPINKYDVEEVERISTKKDDRGCR